MPKTDKTKKSKKEKTIHPNSRKAAQLNKAEHKDERKKKQKDDRYEKDGHLWKKIQWFKDQLVDGKERYSVVEVSELISKYINRFQGRLDEIRESNDTNKQLGRHGWAHVAEEAGIKMVYERESNLFATGNFEAPDITNRANLKALRELGEDSKELQRIKLRNFKQLSAVEMDIEVTCDENKIINENKEIINDTGGDVIVTTEIGKVSSDTKVL